MTVPELEDILNNSPSWWGTTNKEIVNTIILDIVSNSINKPYIKLSDQVFKAIFYLKKFNYENIYSKANTKEQLDYYKKQGVTLRDNRVEAMKKYNGIEEYWWLRSARSNNTDYFVYVDGAGVWGYFPADGSNGVSPAFRIA